MDQPHHAYYRACHGSWASPFAVQLTSWAAFRATPATLLDRVQALSLLLAVRWLGGFAMETEVDYHTDGPTKGLVAHHTRLVKWGLVLFRGAEFFTLHDDGRTVGVHGTEAFAPMLSWTRPMGPATCVVDADGRAASYTFSWLGTTLHQRVVLVEGGVDIDQRTPWSHGEQQLRRRPGTA